MADVVLLHFDGADASTTITDDGSGGATWVAANEAALDTAESKFGGASLKVDASFDWVHSTDIGNVLPASGGWTIDFWYKSTAGANGCLFHYANAASAGILLRRNGSNLEIYLSSNGTSNDIALGTTETVPFTTGWHHIALVRDDTDGEYYLYFDGVLELSVTSASQITNTLSELSIGDTTNNLGASPDAWIDEFRVADTNEFPGGTTFTPPSSAYGAGIEYEHIATGGITFGGAGDFSFSPYVHVATGGITFGGAATVSFVSSDPIDFQHTATGGIRFGGTAEVEASSDANVTGTIDAQFDALSASISASVSPVASISATLPAMSVSMAGGIEGIDAVLPAMTASMTAFSSTIGTINTRLTLLSSDLTGSTPAVATMSVRFPRMRSRLYARGNAVGTIDATLRTLRSALTAHAGVVGTIDAELPALEASAQGMIDVTGTVDVRFARMIAALDGEVAEAQVAVFVLNTVNMALTEYEQFPFNSFAEFGGAYYAAGSGGIYALDDSDDDEGVDIDASFKTGLLDFKSEFQKRLADVYATMRANGQVLCKIATDEGAQYSYTLDPLAVATLKPRRVPIGKGIRGKNFEFEYENVDGSSFEFDTLAVDVAFGKTRRL